MRVIYRPLRGGKTTELIKMSAENQHYIVCMSHMECHRIAKMARDMKLDIPFPITFDDFIRRDYHPKGVKGLLVDNADLLIRYMAGVPVGAITITMGEE